MSARGPEENLLEEIEQMLREEGLLPAECDESLDLEEPVDPPRRVVELGPWLDAIFEGEPANRLCVMGKNGSEELPYFDPDGYSDDQLVEKLLPQVTVS